MFPVQLQSSLGGSAKGSHNCMEVHLLLWPSPAPSFTSSEESLLPVLLNQPPWCKLHFRVNCWGTDLQREIDELVITHSPWGIEGESFPIIKLGEEELQRITKSMKGVLDFAECGDWDLTHARKAFSWEACWGLLLMAGQGNRRGNELQMWVLEKQASWKIFIQEAGLGDEMTPSWWTARCQGSRVPSYWLVRRGNVF